MSGYHFFAFLKRMRFIKRWSLMRNTMSENIQEHSIETAWIVHQLGLIRNVYYGGSVDVHRLVIIALYHDASEIFTGDMPTPIKYFDDQMRSIYGKIEEAAQKKLLHTLPKEMQSAYEPYLVNPEEDPDWPLVKAADTLSAYMKCLAECAAGNREFKEALETIEQKLEGYQLPEVAKFMELYIPSLSLSLDELHYSMDQELASLKEDQTLHKEDHTL